MRVGNWPSDPIARRKEIASRIVDTDVEIKRLWKALGQVPDVGIGLPVTGVSPFLFFCEPDSPEEFCPDESGSVPQSDNEAGSAGDISGVGIKCNSMARPNAYHVSVDGWRDDTPATPPDDCSVMGTEFRLINIGACQYINYYPGGTYPALPSEPYFVGGLGHAERGYWITIEFEFGQPAFGGAEFVAGGTSTQLNITVRQSGIISSASSGPSLSDPAASIFTFTGFPNPSTPFGVWSPNASHQTISGTAQCVFDAATISPA